MKPQETESALFETDNDWDVTFGYGELKELHRGVYATTYRAKKAGRYFILKCAVSDDPTITGILRREYELSPRISHPNIATVYSYECIEGLGECIVMEYADGRRLSEYLACNPGRKERERLLDQLLSAVDHIHRSGIIHNDLKPDNMIVLSRDSSLKLIDFGLSDDESHYLARTLGCTPEYASPELLAHEGAMDCRSDIYSLGKIIRDMFPHRYGCITRKCTRLAKERRYGSTAALRKAIQRSRRIPLIAAVALCMLAIGFAIVNGKATVRPDSAAPAEAIAADAPGVNENGIASEKEAESVSVNGKLTTGDQAVIANAETRYDAIYKEAAARITAAPYKVFAYAEVTRFVNQFNAERDSALESITDQRCRDDFYARSEAKASGMMKELYALAGQRPDYGNLSTEEINFYNSLALKGEPFRPYQNN